MTIQADIPQLPGTRGGISWQRVTAVMRKDWLEVARSKQVITSLVAVPLCSPSFSPQQSSCSAAQASSPPQSQDCRDFSKICPQESPRRTTPPTRRSCTR